MAKPATKVPLEDFFKNPAYSQLQLSPNGKYLAALIDVLDRRNLMVMETNNLGKYEVLTGFKKQNVGSFFWANNDRIVFTMDSSNGKEALSLFTVERGKKKPKIVQLLGAEGTTRGVVSANVAHRLPDDPNHIIVSYNRRYIEAPDLYKIALDSKWNVKRKRNHSMELIAKNPGNIQGWVLDHDGDVRAAVSVDELKGKFLYKNKGEDKFRTLFEHSIFDEQITPLGFNFDNKTMYVASNIGRDRMAIYNFDPNTAKLGEMIYGHDEVDVTGLIMSRKRQKLVGISYAADYPESVYFDAKEKQLKASFAKVFKGKRVNTASISKDESLRVLIAHSDNDPGTYYLYDSVKNKLSMLAQPMGWLKPQDLVAMKPFRLQSRDDLTLRGYLTLPKGSDGKNLPMIINPHGGPFGVRDNWGFNPEIQFLANRGYAVAQVNFRGSGGYGRKFEQAGYGGKWGAEMQNDITDTVKYLIKEGIADPKRICIYGASYGGYATMAGLTFTPELYKCGVNNVGVTDTKLLFDTLPKHWENGRKALEHQIGDPEDKALMERMSPLAHVDKIQVPVFIIHGRRDIRVKYAHATKLREKLDDLNKPYKWLVKDDEGHGFRKVENKIDMYTQLEEFFAKNL